MAIVIERKKLSEPHVKRKFPPIDSQREAHQAKAPGAAAVKKGAEAFPGKGSGDWDEVRPQAICVGNIERHPANRTIRADELGDLVRSLAQDGLLNPLRVRRKGPGYQLIAGERRWLAATRLGWETIDCFVVDCSDAEALRLLNVDNAQRKDLTTVEKARAIRCLHAAESDGGGGLTWEEAGAIYGMSGAGAQNLVKLLDAPQVWLERMEDQDAQRPVYQATVREIAKFAEHAQVLKAIESQYRKGFWPVERDRQVDLIASTIQREFRVVAKKRYSTVDHREHPCYLDTANPIVRGDLEIVSLPLGANGALVDVALNGRTFDARQEDEVKKRFAKKQATGDKREAAKAKTRTPAEQKALAKEQDEKLAKAIGVWKTQMLRCASAAATQAGEWRTLALLPLLLAEANSAAGYRALDVENFFRESLDPLLNGAARWDQKRKNGLAERLLGRLTGSGDEVTEIEQIGRRLVQLVLWPRPLAGEPFQADDPGPVRSATVPPERMPQIADELVEWIAKLLDVTLAGAWKAGADNSRQESDARKMVRRFFELHTARQLGDLAGEYDRPGLTPGAPKGELVEAFLALHTPAKPLKLPSCLAAAAKSRAKK